MRRLHGRGERLGHGRLRGVDVAGRQLRARERNPARNVRARLGVPGEHRDGPGKVEAVVDEEGPHVLPGRLGELGRLLPEDLVRPIDERFGLRRNLDQRGQRPHELGVLAFGQDLLVPANRRVAVPQQRVDLRPMLGGEHRRRIGRQRPVVSRRGLLELPRFEMTDAALHVQPGGEPVLRGRHLRLRAIEQPIGLGHVPALVLQVGERGQRREVLLRGSDPFPHRPRVVVAPFRQRHVGEQRLRLERVGIADRTGPGEVGFGVGETVQGHRRAGARLQQLGGRHAVDPDRRVSDRLAERSEIAAEVAALQENGDQPSEESRRRIPVDLRLQVGDQREVVVLLLAGKTRGPGLPGPLVRLLRRTAAATPDRQRRYEEKDPRRSAGHRRPCASAAPRGTGTPSGSRRRSRRCGRSGSPRSSPSRRSPRRSTSRPTAAAGRTRRPPACAR